MAIAVSCTCGKTLSVKDELAGKRGKCPACGTMLSIPQPPKPAPKPVPQPAPKPAPKPAEPEEWGLVPLDDEPKPAKPAPAKPAVAKPVQNVAKPQASEPSKPVPSKPAPALLDDDFGLAPLDDDVTKPVKPAPQNPKPAAKPAPPVANATPAAPAKPAAKPAPAAPNVAPAKNNLGGAAPAMLDLPPLEEDGTPATTKPGTSIAGAVKPPATAAVAPAAKNLGGPAPLDLPALDGGEDPNHASWIEEGAETEFKVAGPPVLKATGSIGTPMISKPIVHEEREGDLVCPHCGDPLQRTVTIFSFALQIVMKLFLSFYFQPTTPFKCRRCGPIAFEELRGASRRTAEKGCLGNGIKVLFGAIAVLALVAVLGYWLLMYIADYPKREEERRREQQMEIDRKNRAETEERMREQYRRQQELRAKGITPRQYPRPTTPPRSTPPNTMPEPSRPNPKVTQPMNPAPVNPFEPTPLPPTPAPKPMPENPFQPID